MKLRFPKLRPPTLREVRIAVPIALPVMVMSVFVLRGCSTAHVPNVHPPADFAGAGGPTTTAVQDLTGIALVAVNGTTVPQGVRADGTAHLTGTVNGPQGPVPNATVRVEHLVRGAPPIDVLAGPDGKWDLPNIAGGRYRIRAFLVPSLAQLDPQVFFLEDGKAQNFDLTVESFAGLSITSAIAPDPPTVNKTFSLVVRVARRMVDTDGVVRSQGIANATVAITSAQGFSVKSPTSASTNATGDASFDIDCKSSGASQIQVAARVLPSDTPQTATLQLSACVDQTTTTTTATTAPPSSGPPPSSSASSSPPPN